MNRFDLSGRVAVVTGGGRGIGLAIAEGLAAQGASVIVCGRNAAQLDAAAARLPAPPAGPRPLGVPMDVTSEDDVAAGAKTILAHAGRIDILVNNAGIDPHYAAAEKTSAEAWQEIIDVNLTGVFRCCRLMGAAMIPQKSGAIINISSIAGHIGMKRQVPYCASKGGVELMTRALAADWAEHGIRVNAIAYGFVMTDLTRQVLTHEHIGPRYLSRIPLGRFGTLDDVAGAAVFLASPAAGYITGHSVMVDGGWTAN